MTTPPSILILGYGNPGRLDDALGPALANNIERLNLPAIHTDATYQLNIEDAADITSHDIVIFADATVAGDAPGSFQRLLPRPAESFSSHVMRPEAVVALAADALGFTGRAYLLAVRGYDFNEYEERLSARAQTNLKAQTNLLVRALANNAKDIDQHTTAPPTNDSVALCNAPCDCANPPIAITNQGAP